AGHAEADLAQEASLREAVARHAPDLVINAGAYTAVDKAEDEVEAARAANATGPGHLAELCAARGIPLVHISTDYVFDGRLDRPYREDDAT
ncbi:SDR family oxidoreductase, partial [Staphylococcus aureus]